jgi:hypothetical protein
MTFEERIERLTERHEALSQTVELIASEHRNLLSRMQENAEENRQRDQRMTEVMEAIARLLHVAEIHEHRIERLEKQ